MVVKGRGECTSDCECDQRGASQPGGEGSAFLHILRGRRKKTNENAGEGCWWEGEVCCCVLHVLQWKASLFVLDAAGCWMNPHIPSQVHTYMAGHFLFVCFSPYPPPGGIFGVVAVGD